MTNEELGAIIEAHRADSLGVEDGELTIERATALDRYHGRPYGNEQAGRSSVVSKDVSEAIDWAMPAILRMFVGTGSVAAFEPIGPEDEQQAELEGEYVNQVVMRDNPGWLVIHDAIKDTLLLKNGYVKHWWAEETKIEEPQYSGLMIEQVQRLMADLQADGAKVEVVGQDERVIETPAGLVPVFDVRLRIERKIGRVRIEAVPTEEVRVSRKCRGSLQDSPFTEHVTKKTRSDLIEMGMPRDFVDDLPAYMPAQSTQAFSRDSVSDESDQDDSGTLADRSMDEVEYCEAYVKVDFDGDGIAELRRVVTVGKRIPDGEEWNRPIEEVALTGFVAKRVPHRHVGESVFDDLGDLQEIKTALMRQLLDNVYRTNDNQWLVNERVNLNDFLTSLPGGIKRVEGLDPVAGAAMPMVTTPIIDKILPVVDYIDRVKENRTGITKAAAGLDPETLSNVTKGAFMENLARASQKIEMMTRLIAETGVKELVLRVHALLTRYQDQARMMRMKGQFVQVNPQGWRERTDVSVRVGLGTGNEEEKRQKLMLVAQLQRDMLGPLGMVSPNHGYALFSDIVKALGFDMPQKYAMAPDTPEFQQRANQPPPLPPQVQAKQLELQADAQKFQAESAMKMQQAQNEMQVQQAIDRNRQEVEARQKALEQQGQLEIERMRLQAEDLKHQREIEFQRWKVELDAATRIQTDNMQPSPATAAAEAEIGREIQP